MNAQTETQDLDFRVVVGSFRQGYRATPHGTVWAIRPYDAQWGGGGADTCARFDVSTRQWSWGDAGELPFGRGEALKEAFMKVLPNRFVLADEAAINASEKAIHEGGGLHLRYLGADYDES